MIGDVNFSALGRNVHFELDLDPANKHHNNLIAHLQGGACYDEEVAWLLLRTLQPGDFAVDVGANLGFFTLMMSQLVGEDGAVTAIEPVPENVVQLRAHIENNAISNVTVFEGPLWKSTEIMPFHINVDDQGGSALWPPERWWENVNTKVRPQVIRMATATLDYLLLDDECPKMIKIDTEGADQAILEGAQKILAWHPEYIAVELNPFGMQQLGYNTVDFRKFMKHYGYDLFFLNPEDRLPTYVPDDVVVGYRNKMQVKNALFSTHEAVAKAWPEAIG